MPPNRLQSGFTLIETLLYVLFLSLILSAALGAAYSIIQGSERTTIQVATAEEANFLSRKISWALTGASAVSFPAADHLSITRWSTPTSVDFRLNAGAMEMDRGDGWVVLTGAGNTISSVSFDHLTSPEGVQANFAVNGTAFVLTKYLRK